MRADIEAVRVAEFYAAHPLLNKMPVPRFRLPDITIDVPVVIEEVEVEAAGSAPRGAPSMAAMLKTFDAVLSARLAKDRIAVTATQKRKLALNLRKRAASLTKPNEIAIDVNRVADALARTAAKSLSESGGPVKTERRTELEKKLKEAARGEFLKLRRPPARLNVLVTTAEIREAGPYENLTHVHLKITEESVEWTTIECDGEEIERLIIE
jgi:hypothetical protein